MKSILNVLIISTIFLFSCKNQNYKDELNPTSTILAPVQKSVLEDSIQLIFPNYQDSLNYTDTKGWKQGKHNNLDYDDMHILNAFFVNDTIEGYFTFQNGMKMDGFYENGKKHGNWNWYYEDGNIMLITHYEYDSIIWSAPYIANKDLVVPIKHFHPKAKNFYMKAPHPNGNLWYEGEFSNKLPVGIHQVYFENGKLKGTIDYTYRNYVEYDSIGSIIKKDTVC